MVTKLGILKSSKPPSLLNTVAWQPSSLTFILVACSMGRVRYTDIPLLLYTLPPKNRLENQQNSNPTFQLIRTCRLATTHGDCWSSQCFFSRFCGRKTIVFTNDPCKRVCFKGSPGLIQGVHRSWALAENNDKSSNNSNLGLKENFSYPEMPSFTSPPGSLDCFLWHL